MRKSNVLIVTINLLYLLEFPLNAQIEVATSGHVGIGGYTPDGSYELFVQDAKLDGIVLFDSEYVGIIVCMDGYFKVMRPETNNYSKVGKTSYAFKEMHSYAYYNPSDTRQKENIVEIQNSIDLICQLNAVKYDLKEEYVFIDSLVYPPDLLAELEEGRKDKIGFLAQDVEEILPQLVLYDDIADTYAINYIGIIPLLTQAIKEQQNSIKNLETEIESLKNSNLKSLSISNVDNSQLPVQSKLYQNVPNPFGETTSIRYSLSDETKNAHLIIFDMTGKQLERISLTEFGESSIQIDGIRLNPGMYKYSMIADNQIIDTKQMVIYE